MEALKNTAPDTFDDIAYQMYSPYLRGGELKAQEFTYYDPQTELKHLVRSIGLARTTTQARANKAKKEVLIGTVSNNYGYKLQANALSPIKIVILLYSQGWFLTQVQVPSVIQTALKH